MARCPGFGVSIVGRGMYPKKTKEAARRARASEHLAGPFTGAAEGAAAQGLPRILGRCQVAWVRRREP